MESFYTVVRALLLLQINTHSVFESFSGKSIFTSITISRYIYIDTISTWC